MEARSPESHHMPLLHRFVVCVSPLVNEIETNEGMGCAQGFGTLLGRTRATPRNGWSQMWIMVELQPRDQLLRQATIRRCVLHHGGNGRIRGGERKRRTRLTKSTRDTYSTTQSAYDLLQRSSTIACLNVPKAGLCKKQRITSKGTCKSRTPLWNLFGRRRPPPSLQTAQLLNRIGRQCICIMQWATMMQKGPCTRNRPQRNKINQPAESS